MSAQSPLYWHQGLFLTPQHFQLVDWHQHYKFTTQNKYSLRYFRGIGALELREDALAAKKIEVTRLEAMFTEGACVSYPGNAVVGTRSLDEAALESDKPVTVYLGIKKVNLQGGNVTVMPELAVTGQPSTTFITKADADSLPDLHGNGPPAQVKTMQFAVAVYFEHELPVLGDYLLIPVARVVREAEKIRFDEEFIPPCLTIGSSPALEKLVKDVSDLVASRARALEDYKMRGELTSKEFDPGYMVFLMALMTLNRYAPLFLHQVETLAVHPWDVYGTYRQFLGELSTFADDFGATGERFDGEKLVPSYNHDDLTACFTAARKLIERMIEGIGTSIELLAVFQKKDSYYVAEIPERVLTPTNRFWLIIRTDQTPESVPQTVLATVKLCASPLMATLLVKAVPGVPLTYSKNPPAGLPKRSGTHYFLLDTTNPLWLDVVRNKSLSMFWDSPPEDLSAHLAVLRGK
ncbi:MAG: type VI secretion system baseplate subunit TssK [Desulfovibrio sp.]|nr:type VI secretion system baseplate subunit TssK [Desulfovibrio sp.]MBI4959090.1 type VI secretion system baseplate subunit TssK [Desulfovibrio sp.]